MKDAGRIGFVIRGEYSGTNTYDFLDLVYYNGSSYVAKKETTGNPPVESDEFWQIFSSKGEAGGVYGVKGDREIEYREGNVNLTAEDIGALATSFEVSRIKVVPFLPEDSEISDTTVYLSLQ